MWKNFLIGCCLGRALQVKVVEPVAGHRQQIFDSIRCHGYQCLDLKKNNNKLRKKNEWKFSGRQESDERRAASRRASRASPFALHQTSQQVETATEASQLDGESDLLVSSTFGGNE